MTANILNYTIGIKTRNAEGKDCSSNLIFKGATLPTCARTKYTADSDNVRVEVLKNDEASEKTTCACKCQTLGSFDIPLPPGSEKEMELIFTAGLNGLLICTVVCGETRIERSIDL